MINESEEEKSEEKDEFNWPLASLKNTIRDLINEIDMKISDAEAQGKNILEIEKASTLNKLLKENKDYLRTRYSVDKAFEVRRWLDFLSKLNSVRQRLHWTEACLDLDYSSEDDVHGFGKDFK